MSHIPSHHDGTDETHQNFSVILKVHGDSIHLWHHERMQPIGKTHSFRVSCHNVETHSNHPGSNIQVFVLNEPAPILEECKFDQQQHSGREIAKSDLAIFMTGPVSSSRRASYAIDLGISPAGATATGQIDDGTSPGSQTTNCEKVGTAYIYLDPRFSSQGIQKTPIIAAQNHAPIGQIQVDYLIITNPIAYGQPRPEPEWLFKQGRLDSGHRGTGSGRRTDLPGKLLENTIASFNYAHRHGADMCELDVLVSADGVPVVYHDFDVDAVTAQQSCGELGKFRVQVNEFTAKQLRDFHLLSMNDDEHGQYTLMVDNQQESNKPFPTLAEVLDQVDETCGFNIEIKWPQLLVSGKFEARKYREINDFVDRIINVACKHGRNRRIVLESFDADLVIMLRLKQTKFPVVFLSQCLTDRYEHYVDIRARSLRNGIYFGQAFGLAGIDIILEYYIMSGRKLVDFIRKHGLVARAWGDLGEDSIKTLAFLKEIGLQCVTYDKVDLVKQQLKLLPIELEDDDYRKQHSRSQLSIDQGKQEKEEEDFGAWSRVVGEIS